VGLASRVERSEILRILVRASSYLGYFSWKNQATVFLFLKQIFPTDSENGARRKMRYVQLVTY
jgi:hypothetical protein